MTTKSKMKDALEQLLLVKENKLTPEQVRTIAEEGLSAAPKTNVFEKKVGELTTLVLDGNFGMLFEKHEVVAETLNAKNIASPSGKPWTRSNVSKIMVRVRDNVTNQMSGGANATTAAASPDTTSPAAVAKADAATADVAAAIAEPIIENEDDDLDGLEGIDDLIGEDEGDDLPAI